MHRVVLLRFGTMQLSWHEQPLVQECYIIYAFTAKSIRIHIWHSDVLVTDTEVEWIIPLDNNKSGVWHRSLMRARNSTLKNEKSNSKRRTTLGQTSQSPEGLCPLKASFSLFVISLQWTERWAYCLHLVQTLRVKCLQSNLEARNQLSCLTYIHICRTYVSPLFK